MNDDANHKLDQTDEDILTYEVSDEALEAAASAPMRSLVALTGVGPADCC